MQTSNDSGVVGNHDTSSSTDNTAVKPSEWTLAVNEDQISKHPDLAVHFVHPHVTRAGWTVPNRVVAKFEHHMEKEAVSLFYEIRSRGLFVLRNWLGY
jgi:hypothetical protein